MERRWRVQVEAVESLENPEHRFGDTARWIAHKVKQDEEILHDLHIEVSNGIEKQTHDKPFGVPESGTKSFEDRRNDFVWFVEAPPEGEVLSFRVVKKHKTQKDALVGEAFISRPNGRERLPLRRESKLGRNEKGFICVEVREAIPPKNNAAAPPTASVPSRPTLPAAAVERTPMEGSMVSSHDNSSGNVVATCMACGAGLLDMAKQLLQTAIATVRPQDNQILQVNFMRQKAADASVVKLPSGLMYKVLQRGSGQVHPAVHNEVACRYKGSFVNGRVFDQSGGQEAQFPVSRVVPGWTEALKKMVVGDKWELYIPPHLGYGERGAPPHIPGNSVLVFELELVRIVGRR